MYIQGYVIVIVARTFSSRPPMCASTMYNECIQYVAGINGNCIIRLYNVVSFS